jgi:hypothetical protein
MFKAFVSLLSEDASYFVRVELQFTKRITQFSASTSRHCVIRRADFFQAADLLCKRKALGVDAP